MKVSYQIPLELGLQVTEPPDVVVCAFNTEPSLHPKLLLLKGPPWRMLDAAFPAKLQYFLICSAFAPVLRVNLAESSQQ